MSEETAYCPEGIEWEDRRRFGSLRAFLITWKRLVLAPSSFFRCLVKGNSLLDPFLFAIIFIAIVAFFNIYFRFSTIRIVESWFLRGVFFPWSMTLGGKPLALIAWMIYALLGFFVNTLVYSFCLFIVKGKVSYRQVFRVYSYVNGVSVLSVIPFIGTIIASVYGIVLLTIGFREAAGISTKRAFLAAIMPLVFVAVFFLFIGLIIFLILIRFGS